MLQAKTNGPIFAGATISSALVSQVGLSAIILILWYQFVDCLQCHDIVALFLPGAREFRRLSSVLPKSGASLPVHAGGHCWFTLKAVG